MPEQNAHRGWVDRYVRDQMTEQEMAAFEETLMDSPALQQELETVLALRGALSMQPAPPPEFEAGSESDATQTLTGAGKWQGLALAAMVVLAVFSTVMFWKTSNDAADLKRQLTQLGQPRTQVLTVPVDIMRSAGSQTPDVIVKKPPGHSAILLDIELTPAARQLDLLNFSLVDPDETLVATWVASPNPQGHSTAVFNTEDVPASRLWLEISTPGGELIERRLLEFR